jgi:putative N6-adenine-specific DNA methylase
MIFGMQFLMDVMVKVKKHGFKVVHSESGRVFVDAGYSDTPYLNFWMRSAERVLYVVGTFEAESFDELYEGVKNLDWSFLSKDPKIWVAKVRSVSSKLFSERTVQSVSMKAIVDKVKKVDGDIEYPVYVYLRKNKVVVAVDTSGKGLHVRGYRLKYSKAPLRETIAASLLILARYSSQTFHDPFCGSGTIAIEAALMAKNMPPGWKRNFISEKWPELGSIYENLRKDSRRLINDETVKIRCSDVDEEILKVAKENAESCLLYTSPSPRD